MRYLVLTAVLLGFGGVAFAADGSAPTPSTEQSKPADDDPMICKRTTNTGSHIPTKTCMKKSDWKRMEKESQEMIEKGQRNQVNPSSG